MVLGANEQNNPAICRRRRRRTTQSVCTARYPRCTRYRRGSRYVTSRYVTLSHGTGVVVTGWWKSVKACLQTYTSTSTSTHAYNPEKNLWVCTSPARTRFTDGVLHLRPITRCMLLVSKRIRKSSCRGKGLLPAHLLGTKNK